MCYDNKLYLYIIVKFYDLINKCDLSNLDLFNKFLFHSPNPIACRINLSINSFGTPTASYPGDVF